MKMRHAASTQDRDNYSWDAKSASVTQPIPATQILEMGPSEPERCLNRDLFSFYSGGKEFCEFAHTFMTFSPYIFFSISDNYVCE